MPGVREPIHLRLTLMPLVVHPRNLPFVHDIALPSRHQETRYLLEMHVHEEDVQSYICKKNILEQHRKRKKKKKKEKKKNKKNKKKKRIRKKRKIKVAK